MKPRVPHLRKWKLITLFSIIIMYSVPLAAQLDISLESAKMQAAYRNPGSISFDVRYRYAMESNPSIVVDSGLGTFKLSGSYYWGMIDSIEFMQNDRYLVSLYKPDKIMSISNPSNIYPNIVGFSSFDSLFGKDNYITSLNVSGIFKTITLNFTDSLAMYKNYSVTYDSVTNLVKQIKYLIREEQDEFSDNVNRQGTKSAGSYMIVKADYFNYQKIAFEQTFFDASNYFLLREKVFSPQPIYGDYEVFVASPNLLK